MVSYLTSAGLPRLSQKEAITRCLFVSYWSNETKMALPNITRRMHINHKTCPIVGYQTQHFSKSRATSGYPPGRNVVYLYDVSRHVLEVARLSMLVNKNTTRHTTAVLPAS